MSPSKDPLELAAAGAARAGAAAALNPTETAIAAIWTDLLGVEPVEGGDRFSDLGGTSLLAERMLARVRRDLSVPATAATLVDAPDLRTFARRIEAEHQSSFRRSSTTMVPLRASGRPSAPLLLCVAGAAATAASFLELVGSLDPDIDVVAFQARGLEGRGRPHWTVRGAARHHIRSLVSLRHNGPLVLLGHSFGGHIAAEMARGLAPTGRVTATVLLDTIAARPDRGSVADLVVTDTRRPPFRQRLRTHFRVMTAGIIRFDVVTHHDALWEQAIRVQNRYRTPPTPANTTVVITDTNAEQERCWLSLLGESGRIVRVPGDHNSVLNDPGNLQVVTRLVESAFSPADMPSERSMPSKDSR